MKVSPSKSRGSTTSFAASRCPVGSTATRAGGGSRMLARPECAIGVLIYQMGMAAFVPLGFYFAMALKAWRLYATSGNLTQGLAGFGVMVVLLNGLFQEEALFAPPALGLLLSLTGLVIGSQIRMQTIAEREAELDPSVGYRPAADAALSISSSA